MQVQLIFKWFDFWIGIFYDQKKNWIYLLPIPMVGIIFKLPENWRISSVRNPVCDCQSYETGHVSEYCPIHNENPRDRANDS